MLNIHTLENTVKNNPAVMLYFSAASCNVCHALKPKLFNAIEMEFKEMKIVSVDTALSQEAAAHYGVFAIPTVLVFLDGKEFLRKSRNMSVDEVIKEIARPYEMLLS